MHLAICIGSEGSGIYSDLSISQKQELVLNTKKHLLTSVCVWDTIYGSLKINSNCLEYIQAGIK
jgi:hypothetical protein